ncbi:HIT domain-containing protein [Arboricoccus pini]|nr:HIT domain-containing protein [Arboricoccus pini]
MGQAYDPSNVFARILRGEIPAQKVYESAYALAFHDITPAAATHVLVIPKEAHVSLVDFVANASPATIQGFFQAVTETARLMGVEESGYRILANHGPNSGQEVPHFHVHIVGGQPLGPLLAPASA